MRRVLLSYSVLLALVTIPLTGLLIVLSRSLVSLFFQGGAFTAADTHLVARVQMMFCLEIPFYSVAILYVRAISSLKRNYLIMVEYPDQRFRQCGFEYSLHEDHRTAGDCALNQYGLRDISAVTYA